MAKNEAPEKIYVHKSQYWGLMANNENITKNGIEYTRTDAFIEKACDFLNKVTQGYAIRELLTGENYEGKIVEDFKKYMKGE